MTIIDRRAVLGAMTAASLTSVASATSAKPVKLSVGDPLQRFELLRPGVRTYLVSSLQEGRHIAQNLWRREVMFEQGEGGRRLRIRQHWDGTGPNPGMAKRVSLFEPGTFRPFSHVRVTTSKDKRTVEAFAFGARAITGLPGMADNSRADFSVASDEAMYNFETDMEMLQTLPWAAGYAVSIPFFHPGPGSVPARYLWYVVREDALTGPDGRRLPCWVVACDYNSGGPPTLFWLSKQTQQLIKMEGPGGEGAIRRKTLLF